MIHASSKTVKIGELKPFGYLIQEVSLKVWGLVALVLFSALGVVYSKHVERDFVTKLQTLRDDRDKLHVEWTQLLLERGALGADMRVEKIAREELGMVTPTQKEIVMIKP